MAILIFIVVEFLDEVEKTMAIIGNAFAVKN